MVHVDFVAVLLRLELAGLPLTGGDPVARLGCIRFCVGNVDDLIREIVSLLFACARVLARKFAILNQPYTDRLAAWHSFGITELSETLARRDAFADGCLVRRDLVGRIRHACVPRDCCPVTVTGAPSV